MSQLGNPAAGTPRAARVALLQYLAANDYHFATPTPLTHQRVLDRGRDESRGEDLQAIFGWNQGFEAASLSPALLTAMVQAYALQSDNGTRLSRSTVRVASLGPDLFLHSAFPTIQNDAVFFGPDTYRFARFIAHGLQAPPPVPGPNGRMRVLDIGCGSGAGGVAVIRALTENAELTLNDINPRALELAEANIAAAGLAAHRLPGDAMTQVRGAYEVIVANPPYLDDAHQRAYRHGGGRLGRELSLRMATKALAHLAPGGRFMLYTGVAMVAGRDPLVAELSALLARFDGDWTYDEIDPDVFGEELERPVYADADRIAAVGLSVTRRLP